MSLNEVRGASSDTAKASDANSTLDLPSEVLGIDYKRVFESAPALFLLLGADESFPILNASDGYLRATYTDRDAILGRSLFEVFPDNPEDLGATGTANLRSSLLRVLDSGRPDTMAVQKYDIRRPPSETGGFEERYWSPVNVPVFGPDGRMLFIVHRVEDVTELLRTNRALTSEGETLRLEVLSRGQELQEANRQLREVTEQFQAMYDQGLFAARLRLDGTVADINRSAVEVCGFDRADILDRPFWECGWWNRSPDVQAWVRNAVEQAVSGEMFRGESTYFWGDGSVHIVDFACMPIRDATGRVVVAIATGMDITERVQGEQNQRALEAERQRAEALAEIDRAKTTFFSNVSHEFRTPLTLMLAPIEEAIANAATPPAVRTHLELAHRNSLRLLKLVNSLLDFSRIEAGRVDISYEATHLDVLTRDLASTFRSAMERAGLAFTVECEDLGEPAYVNREMWEKIVLNLLSNAFKFTLHGGVSVRFRREMADAVLEISDTGVGVPKHELPRLFERFHRVEGTAGRTQEGSGIGLALVQELVKLHGGSVSAVSELDRGTTLRVSVPLGTAHLPPERIKASRSLAPTAAGAQAFVQEALRWIPSDAPERPAPRQEEMLPNSRFVKAAGARILLADDNADMRDYVRDLLSANYVVETVADGEQALDAVRRRRPDLVIADIMMPRLDGIGFLKRLRSDESMRDVAVMLLSARAGEEAHVEGLDAGADDYMVKPFSARELLARVGARLELTRMRRENEERFHALVGATSEVIYQMSPDWSELRPLKGRNFVADSEEPDRNWLDKYVFPEDQPQVMARVREAMRTKSVFQLEHRVRRVDGTAGWTYSRAIPFKDVSGNITGWFGAASDVTERKATEQALREREEQLRLATEAAEVGLWDVDVVTDTLFWPPRVKAMFGISPEVPVSMADFYSGLHPADRERTGEAYAAACDPERRALYDVEYRTVGKEDGLIRWVAAKGRGVFDGGGRCVRVIGTAIDITARKRVDQALSDADRRKDEFLAMLAHELRNPLAPIGNASELLSRTLKDDARAQTAIGVIKRQVVQMTRLVDDLLDVSRITQGLIQLKKRPIDIAAVVAQTIETVEPQLREKRHKLSTTASSYEPLFVMGDFARLTQCVGNVLVNAIKYTEPGGEISVRTGSDEANAYIEISDNGTGIAPELLSRVFELFVQSERTLDRAQGGLGIGLAVVRRLVEMHDGEVCARSAGLGLGSSFEIRLPRIARPVSTAAAAESFKAESRRVLVVDDNADAADSLSVLLTFQGHLTQVAYSAQEALACVEAFRPDVGLLDIGLPEMNGYELATKLRAIPGLNGMRLVALTGYGQAEDYQRTQAAGFDDHLVKPVDLAKLERALVGHSESRMDSSGDEGV
ncbi:MAG TPA: ATP-binding protein [Steroidobacteraceae bacterium]|nr:ATP-binding protein [Steroidobacteraceae bacterium]